MVLPLLVKALGVLLVAAGMTSMAHADDAAEIGRAHV